MEKSFYFVMGILVLLVGILVYFLVEEGKRWDQFKIDHHCKVVAHISGNVFNTFGTDSAGNMVVGIGSTSGQTGWLCDDGITYYK